MPGRAATSPNATSISAAASKPETCWSRSPPRSSSIRSRRPRAPSPRCEASLQQAKANRDLAQVTWDRDSKLVQQGWVTQQQGDTDRLTLQAREAAVAVADGQYRGAESATAGPESAEDLSERGRAV